MHLKIKLSNQPTWTLAFPFFAHFVSLNLRQQSFSHALISFNVFICSTTFCKHVIRSSSVHISMYNHIKIHFRVIVDKSEKKSFSSSIYDIFSKEKFIASETFSSFFISLKTLFITLMYPDFVRESLFLQILSYECLQFERLSYLQTVDFLCESYGNMFSCLWNNL